MAFELKIGLQNTADAMVLIDETGVYNSVSNPTGWGAPNYETSDLTTDPTVVVYTPDGTALTSITLTDFLSTDTSYDITADLDSQSVGLTDGVWKFVYTLVFTGPVTKTYTIYNMRLWDVEKRIAELALMDLRVVDFQTHKFLYDRVVVAFDQGEYVLAEDLLNELNEGLDDCSSGFDSTKDCGC